LPSHTRRDCDAAQIVTFIQLVQTRASLRTRRGSVKRYVLQRSTQPLALGFSLFINAAILVLGGSVSSARHDGRRRHQSGIQLLTPVLGPAWRACFLPPRAMFGSELHLDGTLAGQIVMEDSSICG